MKRQVGGLRWQLVFLVFGLLLISAGYASAFAGVSAGLWGARLMALGIAVVIPSIMALGAPLRSRRGQVLGVLLLAVFAVLALAFLAALFLAGDASRQERLFWGFPLPAAIVIYGVGVFPMLLLPLFYALTFEAATWSGERAENLHEPEGGEG
jgi:MFS family permease